MIELIVSAAPAIAVGSFVLATIFAVRAGIAFGRLRHLDQLEGGRTAWGSFLSHTAALQSRVASRTLNVPQFVYMGKIEQAVIRGVQEGLVPAYQAEIQAIVGRSYSGAPITEASGLLVIDSARFPDAVAAVPSYFGEVLSNSGPVSGGKVSMAIGRAA